MLVHIPCLLSVYSVSTEDQDEDDGDQDEDDGDQDEDDGDQDEGEGDEDQDVAVRDEAAEDGADGVAEAGKRSREFSLP